MKLKTAYQLLILLAIAFYGCKQKTVSQATSAKPQPVDIVRGYYSKAEKLKLPLTWKNSANNEPADRRNNIYLEDNDTIFFGKDAPMMRLLGAYPDTSRFFAFLLAYPADDIMPVMVIFNKKGKRIAYELFGYGCGGADCGYYCMGAAFVIENTQHFYAHHEAYYIDCDYEKDAELDTSTLVYKQVRTDGFILVNGSINLKKEKVLEDRKLSFDSPENPLRNSED